MDKIKTEELEKIEEELKQQKMKIADTALKWRDSLYADCDLAHRTELNKERMRHQDELFELMSAYDDIEDRYVMAGSSGRTY